MVFSLDGIIKSTIETSVSEKLGTQINVDSVTTSFFSQSAELKNLTMANPDNPMENVLEIDLIVIQVDGTRALYKKLVINEMTIAGIRFDRPRTMPAEQVKGKPNSKEKGSKGSEKELKRLKIKT